MVNASPRWLGAIPIGLVATILVAGVLLVAGYGVPVGIGMLVGLLIGAVGGLLVGAIVLSRGRRSGGSHAFGEGGFVAHAGASFAPPTDFLRALDLAERVDRSELVRVLAGGDRATANGVEVTLIAAEIRTVGALVHITADHGPRRLMAAPFVAVQVEDDLGTPYEAAGTGGNGSPERMRFEIRFIPAPPPDITELRISIDAFSSPFHDDGDPVAGPWKLRVGL